MRGMMEGRGGREGGKEKKSLPVLLSLAALSLDLKSFSKNV